LRRSQELLFSENIGAFVDGHMVELPGRGYFYVLDVHHNFKGLTVNEVEFYCRMGFGAIAPYLGCNDEKSSVQALLIRFCENDIPSANPQLVYKTTSLKQFFGEWSFV
jgi:hypothetical protein